MGDEAGAYRIWQSTLKINIGKQSPGQHFVTVYSPDGTKVTVPFMVYEQFEPFAPPVAHIRYVNYSYFIPTPTPVVITQVVTHDIVHEVTKTIYVNITPDYEKLNAMQWANLQGAILYWAGISLGVVVLGYVSFTGWRVLKKRKAERGVRDIFGDDIE
jgi:hypothetical protein